MPSVLGGWLVVMHLSLSIACCRASLNAIEVSKVVGKLISGRVYIFESEASFWFIVNYNRVSKENVFCRIRSDLIIESESVKSRQGPGAVSGFAIAQLQATSGGAAMGPWSLARICRVEFVRGGDNSFGQ